MNTLIAKIRRHSFRVHLLALSVMTIAAGLMFLAAQQGARGWSALLIATFVLGNLLELVLP